MFRISFISFNVIVVLSWRYRGSFRVTTIFDLRKVDWSGRQAEADKFPTLLTSSSFKISLKNNNW